MKMTLLKPFLSILMTPTLLLISCDHTNSRKMTPPEVRDNSGKAEGEIAELKISNAVDILFVIDNSESMKVHQENLARNINKLVTVIENNKTLDYHIGITSVFDKRYGFEIAKFNPNGFLFPLKGDTKGLPTNYYTREHNNIDLLAKSLLIGILPLKINGMYVGPEEEQLFSPIYSAFSEPAISSPSNQGFYRPEARLAIIIITDADDSSPNISGSDLDTFLRGLKNSPDGSKISTFGILATNRLNKNGKRFCDKVDPGLKTPDPANIYSFLDASKGSKFSLCGDGDTFDSVMEKIGNQIEGKTAKQIIHLKEIPEYGTIKVYLAASDYQDNDSTCKENDNVCQDNSKKRTDITNWGYDSVNNNIVINSIPKNSPPENKFIKVKYTKVYMANVKNGRTTRF